MARQADGVTPLNVLGEVHCVLTRDGDSFALDALVVDKLDVEVLAGTPFMTANDVATRPATRQVVIKGEKTVYYGQQPQSRPSVRRAQAFLVRCPPQQTALLPGDFIELATPKDSSADTTWALEPRMDALANHYANAEDAWPPPQEVVSVGNSIRVINNTDCPILLRRHEHIGQIRPVHAVDGSDGAPPPLIDSVSKPSSAPHSSRVHVDPDSIMCESDRQLFTDLHCLHDDVFNPMISKYNGASGKIEATVNMGPALPPPRKARLPLYNRDTLITLQQKFDELEHAGVFAKPEDMHISVEYLNLSVLVTKPNGGHRLVTSFGEVAR